MNPKLWLVVVMIALAGLSAWLWTLPADGDPWPPGKPHPQSSGMLGLAGHLVQLPPLAEAPRLAETSTDLQTRLQDTTWQQVVAVLGEPNDRIGGTTATPAHGLWWSIARFDGDTGATGWRDPVVHLHLEIGRGQVARCHWIGGEGIELGVPAAPAAPPPPIPAGKGPPPRD